MEKVNINRANWNELQRIIHVGKYRAQQIIQTREQSGNFRDVFELSTIIGLGSKRMSDILIQGIAIV